MPQQSSNCYSATNNMQRRKGGFITTVSDQSEFRHKLGQCVQRFCHHRQKTTTKHPIPTHSGSQDEVSCLKQNIFGAQVCTLNNWGAITALVKNPLMRIDTLMESTTPNSVHGNDWKFACTVEWEFLCVHNSCVLSRSKIFAILKLLRSGSALVIYNYIENKCALTIFANGSIATILHLQNNSILL